MKTALAQRNSIAPFLFRQKETPDSFESGAGNNDLCGVAENFTLDYIYYMFLYLTYILRTY